MAHQVLLTLPIREVLAATPRTRIVRLDLGPGRFDYRPGQAVMVGLPGSKRRPYSLAGAPHESRRDRSLELLVGAEGNTQEFQRALVPGEWLEIEGPIGGFTFEAMAKDEPLAFVAGGTGIAPIRAMLREALQWLRQPAQLFYVTRGCDDFAYADELDDLSAAGRLLLRRSITRGSLDDNWTEGRGRPTFDQVLPLVRGGPGACFICGPSAFVLHTRQTLIDAGMPADRVHVEAWLQPKPAAAPLLISSRFSAVSFAS
jgi:3-ketosteroid 9alpha-monooxygenase subunit B